MEYTNVHSTAISKVGYDPDTMTLEVHFHNGSQATHQGITPERHQELVGAGSVGLHYIQNFKVPKEKPPVKRRFLN